MMFSMQRPVSFPDGRVGPVLSVRLVASIQSVPCFGHSLPHSPRSSHTGVSISERGQVLSSSEAFVQKLCPCLLLFTWLTSARPLEPLSPSQCHPLQEAFPEHLTPGSSSPVNFSLSLMLFSSWHQLQSVIIFLVFTLWKVNSTEVRPHLSFSLCFPNP